MTGVSLVTAELAPLSSTPAFRVAVEFQLPSNCLRVLRVVDDPNGRWRAEKSFQPEIPCKSFTPPTSPTPTSLTRCSSAPWPCESPQTSPIPWLRTKLGQELYALFELAVTEARRIGAIESDWKTRTAALEANPWTEARA